MLEEKDLPEHFQIVDETCGIETARLLIKELGGITVNILMVNSLRSLIERYIADNAKEIPIKKIASELGMNEKAVLRIMKKISIQINFFAYEKLFFKNFVTFFLKKYIYMLELLQFYKKYGGKLKCLKLNIKKPKKTEVVSTPAFYSFSERKPQFPFNIFRMVEVYNFLPSTATQKYKKLLKLLSEFFLCFI